MRCSARSTPGTMTDNSIALRVAATLAFEDAESGQAVGGLVHGA